MARTESPKGRRLSRIAGSLALFGLVLFMAAFAAIRVAAGHNTTLDWTVVLPIAIAATAVDAVAVGFFIVAWRRERAWRSVR